MRDFLKVVYPDASITYYRVDSIKMVELADVETVRIQFEDGKILLIPRALLAEATLTTSDLVLNELKP